MTFSKFALCAGITIVFSSHLLATDFDDKSEAWSAHQQLKQSSKLDALEWRSVGPIEQGGRVVDIDVPKDQPFTIYAAYASGGLWKSSNNGLSFDSIFNDQPTLIMGDIAIDPQNSQRIWVGTGENNSSRSSYGGMGVYLSEDAGQSWQYKGLGDSDRIGRILVDPNDSNVVYVATLGKLYTEGGQRGIYKTTDGGKTWRNILKGHDNTGFIDLVMKPDDPKTLFAAAWERSRTSWNFVEGGKRSGIYRSTDSGKTWKRLKNGFPHDEFVGRIGLAMSPAQPNTIYASLDNQKPLPESKQEKGSALSSQRIKNMSKETFLKEGKDTIERFIQNNDLETALNAETLIKQLKDNELTMDDIRNELLDNNPNVFAPELTSLEVYRSDDLGDTWKKTHEKPLRNVTYSYGYYFGEIRVSPKNIDKVYVLGMPFIGSKDGGKSWFGLNHDSVHVDYQSMWFNPENPEHFIIGNDGGLDVTYDDGVHWQKLDKQPVGQFYAINVDMASPYNIYGGLQDNGTWKGSSKTDWEDGDSWSFLSGGDGMHVAIDPRDNKTLYVGYQFGNYMRIDPDGSRHTVRPRDAFGEDALRYNWNSPLILSTHNPDIVYFGSNRLFRSMNKGDDWTAISDDLTRSKKRGDVPFATITTISESPLQFGVIWVGSDDGRVNVTFDGGNTWKNINRGLPSDRWVSRIVASRHNKNHAYVSLNGYRNDDDSAYVYKTTNRGKSWKKITHNLPNEAVNVIKEDPVNDNILYVGTDRGVYVSFNKGKEWQSLSNNLPNVPVHDLVVHPREREIVIGTHGRSVWVLDALPLQDLTDEVMKKELHLFYTEDVQSNYRWSSKPSQWFGKEKHLPKKDFVFWSNSNRTLKGSILNKENNAVFEFEIETTKGLNQYRWDLLVDQDKVLKLEKSSLEKTSIEEAENQDKPYHRALEFGYPLYIAAGEYTIELVDGEQTTSSTFKVKKTRSPKPRIKEKPSIRGR